MEFENTIIDIIKIRQSKRKYINQDLDHEQIEAINEILNNHTTGPFGNRITFRLVEKKFVTENHKVTLGTYGFISGAGYFIAGKVESGDRANEDYGYLLEKIILKLTEMGLGTCWLGGTFSRSEFSEILGSEDNMIIPAVTPVGFASDNRSVRESIIRWGAGSDNRKPAGELFFTDPSAGLSASEVALLYETPLEMVRLGPSASNKQPWRVLITPDALHFFLKRTPGYGKMFSTVDLQKIDMGIAMSHFELACRELKLKGGWENINPGPGQTEYGEYCVSWKI